MCVRHDDRYTQTCDKECRFRREVNIKEFEPYSCTSGTEVSIKEFEPNIKEFEPNIKEFEPNIKEFEPCGCTNGT